MNNNDWQEINNKLVKEFIFEDFVAAIKFINIVASIANQLDHHPEIYNIYNKVELKLSTHDKGDIITEKDREFANLVEERLKEI